MVLVTSINCWYLLVMDRIIFPLIHHLSELFRLCFLEGKSTYSVHLYFLPVPCPIIRFSLGWVYVTLQVCMYIFVFLQSQISCHDFLSFCFSYVLGGGALCMELLTKQVFKCIFLLAQDVTVNYMISTNALCCFIFFHAFLSIYLNVQNLLLMFLGFPVAGMEQCLFYWICHHADQCHFSQGKSQSAVWSE